MHKYTFKKEERLCSIRLIQSLFRDGSSFVVYPFRVVYMTVPVLDVPAQVLISISKRRFKLAVKRNRLKRLMREAYRLEKPSDLYPFLQEHSLHLCLALQYVGQEELPLPLLQEKMAKVFGRLKDELNKMDMGKCD